MKEAADAGAQSGGFAADPIPTAFVEDARCVVATSRLAVALRRAEAAGARSGGFAADPIPTAFVDDARCSATSSTVLCCRCQSSCQMKLLWMHHALLALLRKIIFCTLAVCESASQRWQQLDYVA